MEGRRPDPDAVSKRLHSIIGLRGNDSDRGVIAALCQRYDGEKVARELTRNIVRIGRYAHFSWGEINSLSVREFNEVLVELASIINLENGKKEIDPLSLEWDPSSG